MIRRSLAIAAFAIVLSLAIHLIGLSLTTQIPSEPSTGQEATDTVLLNNQFEDFAEVEAAPVEPESASEPEPPTETPPEADIPTSQALVASDDPQRVRAPDFGVAEPVQPDVLEPVNQGESEQGEEPEGETGEPVQAESTPPVTTEAEAEVPSEDDVAQPVEPLLADPVEPVETTEVDVPLEAEETEGTDLAVTDSPRPPTRETPPDPQPTLSGPRDFSALQFPEQAVESPLSRYRRDGADTFTRGSGGTQSGGRGPGNSDETNYAGLVLVHLNRAPPVYVAARGFARVFFQIDPDGSLAWVDVTESSGSPAVERAAKAQVQSAAPFPLPPGGKSRKLSFVYSSN